MAEKPQNDKQRELIRLFQWADGYRKNNYDEMARKHYLQYLAHLETKNTGGNILNDDGTTGRSKLFIPRTYEQLDAWRARLVKSFFSSRPYVDFIPMPRSDLNPALLSQNEIKAKVAAAATDMQLEKNKIVKKYYDFITSVGVFPAGIMGVGWRYEKKMVEKRVPPDLLGRLAAYVKGNKYPLISQEVEEITWDDNELVNIDFFDFWPDPRGKNSDTDSWRFCFHQELTTIDNFKQKLAWLEGLGLGEVYEYDLEKLVNDAKAVEEGRSERQNYLGITTETQDGMDKTGDDSVLFLRHYYNGEEYGILVGDDLVYYGKSPYQRHKKIPFVVQSFEPLPNEVYGRSMVYWLSDLQDELNTTRNQRIDNVSLILNPVLITRGETDETLVSKPGARWKEDFENQYRWLVVPDVTGGAVREEQIIKSDMENTVGTPAIARGTSSGGQTATEVVTQNSNASIRFDIKIQLYEEEIKKLFALMDMNNQQFITKERAVYLYGEEAENAWRMVTPYDFQGEWDYRPTGSNIDPAANKEVRRQQMLQLIELAAKLQLPYDLKALSTDALATFDFRNPYKYAINPEIQAQQQQQQMQQQMGMAQMAHQQELEKIQAQNQGKVDQETVRGLTNLFKEGMKGGAEGGANTGTTQPNQ